MHSRTSVHEVEIQIDNKCHCFRRITLKHPIRCPDSVLPEYLLTHTQVNFLLSDQDKQPNKEHL